MTRTEHNKLIRDRIPEIIQAEGKRFDIEIMSDVEYQQALLTRLSEETPKASGASAEELVTELAELYEIMDAIMAAHSIDKSAVLRVQSERRSQWGGFEQRLKLLWIEDEGA